MKPLKMGILGGIGPEATGMFYLKLIRRMQTEGLVKQNGDFPQIIINSIPAPELISEILNDSDLTMYQQGLVELESMKPDFILMVCNTIHLFHRQLQTAITTELVDLRKIVYEKIKQFACLTVVGTPSTITSGLYEFPGIAYKNPTPEERKELSQAVFMFNKGVEQEKQKQAVEFIIRKYLAQGSQLALLACTEFAVMLEGTSLPTLNTIDIMVDHVITRCKNR